MHLARFYFYTVIHPAKGLLRLVQESIDTAVGMGAVWARPRAPTCAAVTPLRPHKTLGTHNTPAFRPLVVVFKGPAELMKSS